MSTNSPLETDTERCTCHALPFSTVNRAAAPDSGSRGQLIRGVQRGNLVALGQRRIVEDRREEIVETTAERDHRLADVQQLRRARADDVHAQQAAILAMKEHL